MFLLLPAFLFALCFILLGGDLMNDWLAWIISLIRTAINWMSQMYIFDVPVISIIVGIFVLGVLLDALLYKA